MWYTRTSTGSSALHASISMAVGASRRGPCDAIFATRPMTYAAASAAAGSDRWSEQYDSKYG